MDAGMHASTETRRPRPGGVSRFARAVVWGLAFALAHGPGSAFLAYGTFGDYCRSGTWGEVKAVASADRGRVWIDRAIADAARFIGELRCALPPGTLDPRPAR